MIEAARFSPIAMFSPWVPRSSVCPSITTTEPGCSLSQRTTLSRALMSALPTLAWPGANRTATSSGSLALPLSNGAAGAAVSTAARGSAVAAGVAVITGVVVAPAGSVRAGRVISQNRHEFSAHPPKATTIVSDATANIADRVPPRIVVPLPSWFRPPPRSAGSTPR